MRRLLLKPSLHLPKSIASCTHRTLHSNGGATPDLAAAGSMASHLLSRAVVRFRGPDTIRFLQGLLTNDVRRFGEEAAERRGSSPPVTPNLAAAAAAPMYAALLTPQGRFLYDLFVYKPPQAREKLDRTGSGPGSDPDGALELLMDVDVSILYEFLETFKKYRLRAKVEIENAAEEFSCWQRYGGDFSKSGKEPDGGAVGWGAGVAQSGVSSSQGNNLGWQWFRDPRLASFGFRGIFPSNTTPPLVEADKETDEQNYLLWRVEQGVAEGSSEIPKGEAIPLEYNLAGLNAISFDKGCYVGQELIARTHHRGVIRKRLLPLKFHDSSGKEVEQKVAPGSEVMDTASGKKAGIVTTALGCRGLGLFRLDDAFRRQGTLVVQGQEDVKVEAIRPEWWPSEWLQDFQEHTVVA